MDVRVFSGVLLMLLSVSMAAEAGSIIDRARSSGDIVRGKWSSGESLQEGAFQPLSTEQYMEAMDGTPFATKVGCEAGEKFLQIQLSPGTEGDIQNIAVSLNTDYENGYDQQMNFNGPYAAVCNNGVIRCEAGTFEECQGFRWRANDGLLHADLVDQRKLGACYCFNNSCGNALLNQNSRKILDDLGVAIGHALKSDYPRLNMGKAGYPDQWTIDFYGQSSSCGNGDTQPEQYFNNPEQMSEAGKAEQEDPDSTAYFMSNTAVAQEQGAQQVDCSVNRRMQHSSISKFEAVTIHSKSVAQQIDCGNKCLRFRLGYPAGTDNNYSAGCKIFEEWQRLRVEHPEGIEQVKLTSVRYDDWLQLRVADQVQWASPASWTGDGGPSAVPCEAKHNINANADTDVTSYFQQKAVVEHRFRLAVGGAGEGYSYLDFTIGPICKLESESIDDGCAGVSDEPACQLKEEWVDGVHTVSGFYPTGLAPLPSERSFDFEGCIKTYERPWWEIEREYFCENDGSQWDSQAAAERYERIHHSYNPETGEFEDRRKNENGEWETHQESFGQPARQQTQCQPQCKLRRPAPGAATGEMGSRGGSNSDPVAWDYDYRNCTDSGECPLEEDEEQVLDCACRNSFGEAAAFMQTIRMLEQDTVCAPE